MRRTRSVASAGSGLFLALALALVAGTASGPVRTYGARDALTLVRAAHALAGTVFANLPPFRAQGDFSGHGRLLVSTMSRRRGRSPFAAVRPTVLTLRWTDGDLGLSAYRIDAPSSHLLSAWWRAIPAGFNARKRNAIATLCLPPRHPALAHRSILSSHGLRQLTSSTAPSRLQLAPFSLVLNPFSAARLRVPRSGRILGQFPSLTDKRNFA